MVTVSEFASAVSPVVRRASGALVAMLKAASQFGSSGNIALAAGLGVLVFAHGLSAIPATATASASGQAAPTVLASAGMPVEAAAESVTPTTQPLTVAAIPAVETVVGKAPGAVLDTALDYDVAFYWPMSPQTVSEPVAIRSGPAAWSELIRSARPGERLRINGRVQAAPGGPWYRIRLADGRDGFFAASTTDLGAFRRKRAVEAQAARAASDAAAAEAAPLGTPVGAPLPPAETPPPAF